MHKRNVGGGKTTWRTYYSTLRDRFEEQIVWISDLPEQEQTTILGQMETYSTDEIGYLEGGKTDRQWGKTLEKLQKHLNGRRGGSMSDFTVNNTADIIQWFGQKIKYRSETTHKKNTPRTQKKNTAIQSSSKGSSSVASSSEESSASSKQEEEEDGGSDGGDGGMPQMGDMSGKMSLPRFGAITCCCCCHQCAHRSPLTIYFSSSYHSLQHSEGLG